MTFEERLNFDTNIRGTKLDPVNQLFGRLDLHDEELKKYAMFDSMKNYTRNLIATDDETFTLLLLCWNADKESPIHDHVSNYQYHRVYDLLFAASHMTYDVAKLLLLLLSYLIFLALLPLAFCSHAMDVVSNYVSMHLFNFTILIIMPVYIHPNTFPLSHIDRISRMYLTFIT